MIPTLYDVTVLLDFSIDGRALTFIGIQNMVTLWKCAFGWAPFPEMFKGNALCTGWIWENIFKLPDDYDGKIL
jgi:hypothetical protein